MTEKFKNLLHGFDAEPQTESEKKVAEQLSESWERNRTKELTLDLEAEEETLLVLGNCWALIPTSKYQDRRIKKYLVQKFVKTNLLGLSDRVVPALLNK